MAIEDIHFLELIRTRQELHVKFFSVLDTVRWRFTSAFGVGAAVGVLSGFSSELAVPVKLAAQVLVVVLCLAGLVSQVRVYSLLVSQWNRLTELQHFEAEFLQKRGLGDASLYRALASPPVAVDINRLFYYSTVGMASCVVFSAIMGVAVASFHLTLQRPLWAALVSGLATSVLATVLSFQGIKAYVAALERHPRAASIEDPVERAKAS